MDFHILETHLASDRLDIVQPVVILAHEPTCDHSLTEDMTLCPFRALRYYLDKTKDLGQGKHLLFISLRDGFSGDIQRTTITSGLK